MDATRLGLAAPRGARLTLCPCEPVPQGRPKRPSVVVKGLALDSPVRNAATPLPLGLHRLLRSPAGSALIAHPQSKEPTMDDECRAHKLELANLGRAFREARERSGLSEREVADAVPGVSLAGVRAIEAGERPSLNYEQIIRL